MKYLMNMCKSVCVAKSSRHQNDCCHVQRQRLYFYTSLLFPDEADEQTAWIKSILGFILKIVIWMYFYVQNSPNYVHVQLFIDLLQLMLTLFRCNNLWVIVQQHKIKNWFVICSGSSEFSISCISIYLYVSTVTTPTLGTTDLNSFPYWKAPNWVFFSLSE